MATPTPLVSDRRYAADLTIEVKFPTLGNAAQGKATRARVLRADRQMESAYIELFPPSGPRASSWIDQLATGIPVYVSWYARGARGYFSGYIHTVMAANDQRLQIMAVGLGYPLHTSSGHAFANTSTKNVISEICSKHRLAFYTNPKAAQQYNMVQGDKTDWQWLQSVTYRDGLSLHFRGATLLALPLNSILKNNIKAPVDVVIPKGGIDAVFPKSASPVRSFVNKGSDIVDGAWVGSTAYAAITTMGEVANVVVGDGVPQVSTDPVTSPGAALSTRNKKDYARRWTNHATLIMDGVPSLYPLDLVRTSKEGERILDTAWSVLSVKHVMADNDYIMEAELGQEVNRDGMSGDLLDLGIGEVNLFNRPLGRNLGGANSTWYTVPVLRPTSGLTPGQTSRSQNPLKYAWTAEQVVMR